MSKSSLIFDIKRYSINDGPGIRVTVFFKGCPLSCVWCHNPESWSPEATKLFSAFKCLGCKSCIQVCPEQAISFVPKSGIYTDHGLCSLCGSCAQVCPTHAMEICGKEMSVEEVMAVINKEAPLLKSSGGGVTFSGGEPLQHPEFLLELLQNCKRSGIHTAVDTSGFAHPALVQQVALLTDLFLFDLKLMDSVTHRKHTGVSNELILANLSMLAESGYNIWIRIPLIDGINAEESNIRSTAEYISSLSTEKKQVCLLPYHNIASGKYNKMGKEVPIKNLTTPGNEMINNFLDIFAEYGIMVNVGG